MWKIEKQRHRALILILLLALVFGCKSRQPQNTLTVFHAGSLSIPFEEIQQEFEKQESGVKIQLEASGSVSAIRKITDLGRHCDVIALADAALIDEWLIPEKAKWNIHFAGNEIVLAFRPDSKYSDEINSDNWFEILSKPEVRYGRSDPNSDPCGYRTELSLRLANRFYPTGVDYRAILNKDTRFIRPKASDLIALLETKSVDYIFEYVSVASQHDFMILPLPDQINLSNPVFSEFYKTVEVEIQGKLPGEKIVLQGEPMIYGLTILNDALNLELAEKFVQFIISKEYGLEILKRNGQKVISPEFSNRSSSFPNIMLK
jgi:molybdate/tungstate transport system substrate-binding protein